MTYVYNKPRDVFKHFRFHFQVAYPLLFPTTIFGRCTIEYVGNSRIFFMEWENGF